MEVLQLLLALSKVAVQGMDFRNPNNVTITLSCTCYDYDEAQALLYLNKAKAMAEQFIILQTEG